MTPEAIETLRAALRVAHHEGAITGHERDHAEVELANCEQSGLAKAWSEGFYAGSLNENGAQKAVRDGHRMPAPPSNPYGKQQP